MENINGKAIYTTKGAAREYGRVGCNFYTGCPHMCKYCYLKRGVTGPTLGGAEVRLKKCFKDEADAISVFCKEVKKHIDTLEDTGVFFSFTTDPLHDATRDLTFSALGVLCDLGLSAKVLTKSAGWGARKRERMMLEDMASRGDDVQFGWTLTGCDDMEPYASRHVDRFYEMRRVKEMGLSTFASIEPVIDWDSARMAVECSLKYCDHYKIGLRSGVKKDYYNPSESSVALDEMTKVITDAGKTVYLKESARKLLKQYYSPEIYDKILSRTVDMDGNKIKPQM